MSIREQLSTARESLGEERRVMDDTEFGPVRAQITALEAEQQTLQQQLADLTKQHGEATTSLGAYKDSRVALDTKMHDLRVEHGVETVKAAGLTTRESMVEAADADSPDDVEAVRYGTAREELRSRVGAMHETKKNARENLPPEPEPVDATGAVARQPEKKVGIPLATRKLQQRMQQRLEAVQREIFLLSLQTPEGKEKALATLEPRIAERHKHADHYIVTYLESLGKPGNDRDDRSRCGLVSAHDVRDSNEWTVPIVQEALVHHASGVIDRDVERRVQQEGIPGVLADEKTMGAYEGHLGFASQAVSEATRARSRALEDIAGFLDGHDDIAEAIAHYCGVMTPQSGQRRHLAEAFIHNPENAYGDRHYGMWSLSVLEQAIRQATDAQKEIISERNIQTVMRSGTHGDIRRSFYTNIPNPEAIRFHGEMLTRWYEGLAATITANPDSFDPKHVAEGLYESSKRQKTPPDTLTFSGATYHAVVTQRQGFRDAFRRMSREAERIHAEANRCKALLPDKVRADWAFVVEEAYDYQHHTSDIRHRRNQNEQLRTQAETAVREMQTLAGQLVQHGEVIITMSHQTRPKPHIGFSDSLESATTENQATIQRLQTAIDEATRERDVLVPKREKALFKGGLNKQIKDLKETITSKQAGLEAKQTELKTQQAARRAIINLEHIMERTGISESLVQGHGSEQNVADLLQRVNEALKTVLSRPLLPDDDEAVYQAWLGLQREAEAAAQAYNAKRNKPREA